MVKKALIISGLQSLSGYNKIGIRSGEQENPEDEEQLNDNVSEYTGGVL